MKERVILLLFLLLQLPLFAAEEGCTAEGVCALPGADKSVSGVYKVLSPVGESSVRKFKSPEPLKTLSGKRIAIVGGSFMAKITHYELKRLIQRDYSGTRIYVNSADLPEIRSSEKSLRNTAKSRLSLWRSMRSCRGVLLSTCPYS
ncbi:MAG: hypothetical protein IKC77_05485 [Lentisphaeria bacterium]|nr:hypothetical protein [Lentisphaeria bacterium]